MEKINKEEFLTVSEVAKILEINKNTILYYDREGIIHSIRDNNNYRYYHKNQIKNFKAILSLRKSGFSLEEIKEIKEYIFEQNYDYIIQIIKNRIIESKKEIENIKDKLKMLESQEKYMEYLDRVTLENPEKTKVDKKKYRFAEEMDDFFCIKFCNEEHGIFIEIKNLENFNRESIEEILEKYKRNICWLKKHFFGRVISKDELLNENYVFSKFIIKADIETYPKKYIFPEGEYAIFYLKTNIEIEEAIKKMYQKIKESNYKINGDLYIENLSIFDEDKKNEMRILKIPVKVLTSE